MKKIFFALTLIAASLTIVSCSDDDKNDDLRIKYNEVPANAREMLDKHFSGAEGGTINEADILYVEYDKDGTYEVVFKNRIEIDFYKDGTWKEIDLNGNLLPESFAFLEIPATALSYVSDKYPKNEIEDIEKKGRQSETQDFEIELRHDIEVLFDYLGNVKNDNGNNNGGNEVVPIDNLPASIKAFLNKHFEGQQPSRVELEWDKYEITYNHDKANEVEVEFYKNEKFKSIEADGDDKEVRSVMQEIAPNTLTYITNTHEGFRVEEFSMTPSFFTGKYKDGYKVEIEKGTGKDKIEYDIYFDKDGNHIDTKRG